MEFIKFYTSHCPKCRVLMKLMDNKNISYETIDDEDVYLPIAEEYGFMSMPFAGIDGQMLNTKDFEKYIINYEEN